MIINPQIYNLRLTTYALLALVITLGYYSYQNQNSLNEYHDFLLLEKSFVEKELSQMYIDYDNLELENDELSSSLNSYKIKIASVLDSIKYVKADVQLVAHYKKQLQILKKENLRILKLVDRLNAENEFLRQKTIRVETELKESLIASNTLKSKNSNLAYLNNSLNKKINKVKTLTVQNISINGVRRITSSGKIKTTTNAKRAKQLNICFDLPVNNFAEKGTKELYIQIIDPSSNVVGDKGEKTIGKTSLIFSKKVELNYNNKPINECVFLEPLTNEPLIKGTYFVGIYHENKLIGNSTFNLK